MSIQSIDTQIDGLNVVWRDGSSSCFPWLWIRDHSESGVDISQIFILSHYLKFSITNIFYISDHALVYSC